jgi:hypothetical protein
VATQTVSSFDADLKDVYRGTIVELLNNEAYMIDQVEKTNANDMGAFEGRRLVFAVHTGRNRSGLAITDGGTLATAGRQDDLNGIVTIKAFDTAIELTDQVIEQSKGGNVAAFARALTREMDGAMTDLRLKVNRMVYGDGTGLLATALGTEDSTDIRVDTGQYINVGDTVDVLTIADGTDRGTGLTVLAVTFTGTRDSSTQANATIRLSARTRVTSADGFYISGDRNNESDGLRNITGTRRRLHSIDSSSVSAWDGNAVAAGWVNVSEDLLMQQAQTIRQRTGKNVEKFITTYGIQRRLANTYQSQKMWTNEKAVDVDGGYSAIMVAAGSRPVPVIADTDCTNGFVYSLNMEPFAWSQMKAPDWLEPPNGGSIFHLKDGTTAGQKKAIWQAWIMWYATLVCVAPNRQGQISQLKDDVPIPHV